MRTQIRTAIPQPVRAVRAHSARQVPTLAGAAPDSTPMVAQLQVLDDSALAIQPARNLDGQPPFRYASLAVAAALSAMASSLERRETGGTPGSSPPAVPHGRGRTTRAAPRARPEEPLTQDRVRHRRGQFLAGLAARWAETTPRTELLP